MRRIHTDPHFQKSLLFLNPVNTNIQQSPMKLIESTNSNTINSVSRPVIQVKKLNNRYKSPISIKKIEDNNIINGVTPTKIKHINSYNTYVLRPPIYINKITSPVKQTDNKQNYGAVNVSNNLNKTTVNHNHNLISKYTEGIKNQNNMNNVIISQNLIVNQNLKNISNNNINNSNNISMIPYPNVINNTTNKIKQHNQINGIITNQNIINIINSSPNNIKHLKTDINQFGKSINNKISLVPRVEIFLNGNNPKIQNQNIITNKTILQDNNIREPNDTINFLEFKILNQIGQGTFGQIYKVLWMINNKLYALKKEKLQDVEIKERQNRNEVIRKFIKHTNCRGIVHLYGNLIIQKGNSFRYYELMELCERDFEQEIKLRSINMRFYTEQEMYNIMLQLISTLSFLQKNHITHRDIKPQNILILNGIYKLGDFGDIRIMQRDGIVVQRIRGSELYMSPILFNGLRSRLFQVRHNTYKSDVFSLGMCFLLASCLSFDGVIEIRELSDMNQKLSILNKYLSIRYSPKFIQIILLMLQTEEVNRPDFILLEEAIRKYGL